jgi:hypothetical protein
VWLCRFSANLHMQCAYLHMSVCVRLCMCACMCACCLLLQMLMIIFGVAWAWADLFGLFIFADSYTAKDDSTQIYITAKHGYLHARSKFGNLQLFHPIMQTQKPCVSEVLKDLYWFQFLNPGESNTVLHVPKFMAYLLNICMLLDAGVVSFDNAMHLSNMIMYGIHALMVIMGAFKNFCCEVYQLLSVSGK